MKEKFSIREFGRYTGLSTIGAVGVSCYILADTFFIARGMGTDGLASLNIAIPIYNFIWGIAVMLGMGGATRYTIARSRGEYEKGDSIFSTVVAVTLVFSTIFALVGIFGAEWAATMLGANEEILTMTTEYMRVILIFAPAFALNQVFTCFVRNDGEPNLAMMGTLIGSLINIVLDYVLIFPLNLGMLGAALATACSPVVGMAIMWQHKTRGNNQFHLTRSLSDFKNIGKTCALGFPSLATELSSGIVVIVFNMILLGIAGNVAVAAYGVIANISLVVIAIYNGMSQGMQPLMSEAYGHGNMRGARKVLRYGLTTCVIISAVIYFLVFFCAEGITAVFNSENNPQLAVFAVPGLKIYFTAAVFAGFNIILQIYFISTEKALPGQIISLLRGLIVIIPAAFILSQAFGVTGVWMAFPATEATVALVGIMIYAYYKRRIK